MYGDAVEPKLRAMMMVLRKAVQRQAFDWLTQFPGLRWPEAGVWRAEACVVRKKLYHQEAWLLLELCVYYRLTHSSQVSKSERELS